MTSPELLIPSICPESFCRFEKRNHKVPVIYDPPISIVLPGVFVPKPNNQSTESKYIFAKDPLIPYISRLVLSISIEVCISQLTTSKVNSVALVEPIDALCVELSVEGLEVIMAIHISPPEMAALVSYTAT